MGLFGFGRNRSSSKQRSDQQSQSQSGFDPLQRPFFERGYEGLQQLLQGGPQQFYPDSTVNPLNQQQQTAFDNRFARGQAGSPTEDSFRQYLQNALSSGGPDLSAAQGAAGQFAGAGQQGLNTLGQFAGGGNVPGAGERASWNEAGAAPGASYNEAAPWSAQRSIGGQAPTQGIGAGTSDQLRATAGGDYLGSNPYLDASFDRAAGRIGNQFSEQVLPGVQSIFGGAGRAGSPAHERSVAQATRGYGEALSDLGASTYAPAYEAERGRQFAAGSQQASLADSAFGRRFAGGQAERDRQFGLYDSERGREFAGGQAAAGRSFAGGQAAADRGFAGGQAAAGRSFQDAQADAQRGFAGGQNAADRQLGAGGQLGQFGLQGAGLQGNLGLGGYNAQTGRQQGAGALAPAASALDYQNLDAQQYTGDRQRLQADQELGANVDRFNFQQQAPWDLLRQYFGIGGNPLQTSSSTSTGSSTGSSRGSGFNFNAGWG